LEGRCGASLFHNLTTAKRRNEWPGQASYKCYRNVRFFTECLLPVKSSLPCSQDIDFCPVRQPGNKCSVRSIQPLGVVDTCINTEVEEIAWILLHESCKNPWAFTMTQPPQQRPMIISPWRPGGSCACANCRLESAPLSLEPALGRSAMAASAAA
jgi:hypothetical protein